MVTIPIPGQDLRAIKWIPIGAIASAILVGPALGLLQLMVTTPTHQSLIIMSLGIRDLRTRQSRNYPCLTPSMYSSMKTIDQDPTFICPCYISLVSSGTVTCIKRSLYLCYSYYSTHIYYFGLAPFCLVYFPTSSSSSNRVNWSIRHLITSSLYRIA
jgi:hypothetical protein